MQKTVNQIWKEFAENKGFSFKEWVGVEKHLYEKRNPSINFENWINKRYALVKDRFLNFDWNSAKEWLNDNKEAIGAGLGALAGEETSVGDESGSNSSNDKKDDNLPTDNTIFGMPKPLAIGIGLVAVAGLTFGIVKLVKHLKK